jgi:hypothetical protein
MKRSTRQVIVIVGSVWVAHLLILIGKEMALRQLEIALALSGIGFEILS